MKHDVYITRQIPQAGLDLLLQAGVALEINPEDRVLSRGELMEKIKNRDGLLCLLTDTLDKEAVTLLAGRCRGIANYAVGFNNIDIEAATRQGIPVSNTPGVLTDATADQAWALLFSVARRIVESDTHMRSGQWKGWGPMQFLGADVTGATLGIIGAGRIGEAVAERSVGFRMKLLYSDINENSRLEKELNARRVNLDALLRESDFVSLHVALTRETRHLIGRKEFSLMKKTAILINTSRGPVVDEAALVTALRNGQIAGAGLDVYENEPAMHPGLGELKNVVVCPHIASATIQARSAMAVIAAKNLLAMLRGERAPNCVNPQVYEVKKNA